ncbi:uncharacterized protein LOC122380440 isoform X2 [Amphibalanus amphitrite]|uniref:uncharacterized protein LOC122380440 isoform X2 n=1 Tax=Amphibalanus amphitrite TaxID=1232801 RepID=UPI001C90AC5F|nr:uncharacterized protein LOC122380440 isoform X2 [Amphibalanus amphitrite]
MLALWILFFVAAFHVGTVSTIVNCKMARQMCVNHPNCHSITTLIPRLCGQELVACSTVTVTKCTAALRTLVAFQFFQPTCLCKEPRIDPECNKYRNLVFDHPCYTVKQKDKDPYPVHALPTCGYALDACRRQAHCSRLYDNFINSCDFRDNRCLMTNSRACYNAWNQLRLSPVFGCICPDSTAACQQIFDLVHRNPCVVDVLAGGDWDASRRPVDPLLVTPLVDLTSEPTYNSSLTETLYGSTDPFGARGHGGGRSHQPTRYHVSIAAPLPDDSVLRSTCHEARDTCLRDAHCRSKLEPVLSACSERNCDRQICMQRLQNFYRAADTRLSTEVAFCVCRRGPGSGECERALEELHPKCAQRSEGGTRLACHSVAEQCRDDPAGQCRPKLERYEQACAVDSVTSLCAGPTDDCRRALLAVLGTKLRTSCACLGTDISSMNDCRGWERLLFANPCVVQAQREFHQERQEQLRTPPPPRVLPPVLPPVVPQPTRVPYVPRLAATSTTRRWLPTTSTTSTARSTPRRPTTVRTTTTTARRREEEPHCVSRKPGRPDDYLLVGEGIRYYMTDKTTGRNNEVERDCTEICMCHMRNRTTCNVVCTVKKNCKTDMATYHDGSAALRPYRTACICFRGDFVCTRPSSESYMLSFGVFLFLGYSRKEEEILRPHTRRTVRDNTVADLQAVLDRITQRNHINNMDEPKSPCKLSVKQRFPETENIIIQAKIDDVEESYNNSLNKESLDREKNQCAQPLREISFMINNREMAIVSHPLLSVFKMADVVVTIPDASGSPHSAAGAAQLLALTAVVLSLR